MSVTEKTQPRITYRDMRSKAEEIADEKIKERVLAGIEILNEKYGPDWVDHVDPKFLIMSSASSCVLGQVYGDYGDGAHKLWPGEGGFGKTAIEHGFYMNGDSYDELDEAWKIVLA